MMHYFFALAQTYLCFVFGTWNTNFMFELLLSMPTYLFYMIRKSDRRECIYAIFQLRSYY